MNNPIFHSFHLEGEIDIHRRTGTDLMNQTKSVSALQRQPVHQLVISEHRLDGNSPDCVEVVHLARTTRSLPNADWGQSLLEVPGNRGVLRTSQ